ncbi:MAG: PIN domain-containing protein [Candidatus Micrarchaeales archaeon]
MKLAIFVKPTIKVYAVKADPSDNMIIEAALEGKVDCIITGDRALKDLDGFRGIKICSPSAFFSD